MGLQVTGGSCAATTNTTKWNGIIGNGTQTLVVSPAFDAVPTGSCTFYVTDFYLQEDSGALGQGAKHDGTTEPGSVNMGTRLGFVANTQDGASTNVYNWLQQASDDSSLGH